MIPSEARRFGPWFPISDIGIGVAGPGVFQVRLAAGLQDYPLGRSAMVHYQVARELGTAVAQYSARHRAEPWWVRVWSARTWEQADEQYGRLVDHFVKRFGREPHPFVGAGGGSP